jgi:autophagy-related protein 2
VDLSVQGIRDLFWLPIDQYRRDRRIVRGLQRGLFSFSTCSTIALLELSSRTLRLIEVTAQSAHDFMSGSSLRRERMLSARHEAGGRVQQPRDVREGALSAYNVISDGKFRTDS